MEYLDYRSRTRRDVCPSEWTQEKYPFCRLRQEYSGVTQLAEAGNVLHPAQIIPILVEACCVPDTVRQTQQWSDQQQRVVVVPAVVNILGWCHFM